MSDWALYSDGSNDVISFANAITVNLGTWQGVFLYEGRVLTPTATVGIAGTSSSSTVAGPAITVAGAMVIRSSANIIVATSPDGFIIFNEYHVYEFQHDAGGAFRFVRNGVTISSGTYTGGATWTNINQFLRATSAATTRLSAYTKRILFTGVTNGQDWKADLSNGLGSILPTVSGANQGTLVNFPTDNTQWIDTAPPGGTAQDITLVNAQTVVQAQQATISTRQAISVTNAQTVVQAQQIALAVAQVITATNAQTLQQAQTAAVSMVQQVVAVQAQTLVQAQQVTITQGGAPTPQDVTAVNAQQVTQAQQVNIGTNQVIVVVNAQQLEQAQQIAVGTSQAISVTNAQQLEQAQVAAVAMRQQVGVTNAQQLTQAQQVTITQGGAPTPQNITVVTAQQRTEAVTVNCTISQGVISIDAITATEAEPAVVSMVQQIVVNIAQQITQAVTAGEVPAQPINAAKVKVTLKPARFTISIAN